MEVSSPLFFQAATLMLVGMGFVFAFLSLLILVIKTAIAPLAKRYPDEILTDLRSKKIRDTTTATTNNSLVAAISAAVNQYRNNQYRGKNSQNKNNQK